MAMVNNLKHYKVNLLKDNWCWAQKPRIFLYP